ncbi:caldesmon isoform X4 [Phoca vitulina]|uniref:caldesmon isoform X4 n=1 Tax=Phoca vitulina TaxID=9720 RepID=UPI001395F3F2|nr:caldesmon isoform X4 [Phoca vitulina]
MRRERVGRSRFGRGQAQTFVTGTDQSVNTKGEHGSILHPTFQPQKIWHLRAAGPRPDRREGLSTSSNPPPLPAADMLGGSGLQGRRSLAALSQIAYQRNDDDEEEAARERRRRARQERLRQKQEEESLGQVTDQVEVNAQNSVADEEVKTSTSPAQVEGDDEAALLERLARREERRQKRLQEALERQKEFDPTVTDAGLPLPSRRLHNNAADSEAAEKEEKSEHGQERYEIEETEIITKSYQKNDWRDAEEKKQEEKEKEEEEEEKPKQGSREENQIKDEKIKKDKEPKEVKSFLDGKKGFTEVKSQNGEFLTHKLKHTENTFSRPGAGVGARASEAKEAEGASQVEAGKRLEELRRRRGETESEEFEKLKQKQQEAAQELEELKKKREERRKVLEEEEQKRKQEEAERKVREEEEKRRLKEEIERRRAEAAEKRQKMPEDSLSDDKKPFKCFTPKGSSLKIEERAEFLNKSVQKSGVKSTHQAAVVSKIDSRLEQYTSAIEGTKTAKPLKPAASDLPVPAEGVRNIKSMWEKGNVFSSPTAAGTPNKETAGLKVGVSSRINEWLTKTPDGNKSPAPKPSDLRPGDVSGKRNLWEKQSVDKVTSPTKVIYWEDLLFIGSLPAVSCSMMFQGQMRNITDPQSLV